MTLNQSGVLSVRRCEALLYSVIARSLTTFNFSAPVLSFAQLPGLYRNDGSF